MESDSYRSWTHQFHCPSPKYAILSTFHCFLFFLEAENYSSEAWSVHLRFLYTCVCNPLCHPCFLQSVLHPPTPGYSCLSSFGLASSPISLCILLAHIPASLVEVSEAEAQSQAKGLEAESSSWVKLQCICLALFLLIKQECRLTWATHLHVCCKVSCSAPIF